MNPAFQSICEPQILISNFGIALTMLGVYLVYKNSPINENVVDGGTFGDELSPPVGLQEAITRRKNQKMRRGVFIVLIGSGLQIVSTAFQNSQ